MNPFLIVLVEDNPGDVFLVDMALKESGIVFQLLQFNSGSEALKVLFASNVAIPDVILLDLNTPKSDGFDVLMQLRRSPRLSQVSIAILTSSQAQSDKDRAALQNVRFIQKPSQLTEFLAIGEAVKEMLPQ